MNMLYEKNSNLSFVEREVIFVWISFADKSFQMERSQTAKYLQRLGTLGAVERVKVQRRKSFSGFS